MNYLSEPRGQAVPFGLYQDLGGAKQNKKAWSLYRESKFEKAVVYIASLKLKARREVFVFLKKKGVSDKDIKALKAAVKAYRQSQAAAEPEGPNYLLWGGIALAAGLGSYFLFFRKKKGKSR
jgi:LPXTG-motif cell wall-anchored protein